LYILFYLLYPNIHITYIKPLVNYMLFKALLYIKKKKKKKKKFQKINKKISKIKILLKNKKL